MFYKHHLKTCDHIPFTYPSKKDPGRNLWKHRSNPPVYGILLYPDHNPPWFAKEILTSYYTYKPGHRFNGWQARLNLSIVFEIHALGIESLWNDKIWSDTAKSAVSRLLFPAGHVPDNKCTLTNLIGPNQPESEHSQRNQWNTNWHRNTC